MKNSNSLKTENSLTVLPRLLSVSIFGDPVPNKKKEKKCRDMVPYDWPKCQEVKPNKKAGHIVSIDSHSCFPN